MLARSKIRCLVLILISLILFACAGPNYKILQKHMKSDECQLGIQYLKKKENIYGSNMKLNFLLDSAMIHFQCGNYEQSNQLLKSAEDLAEELWTKSISKQLASFVINDYTIPYKGEDFERALINLFSAIDYVMLKQYEEALVECRRLDSVLTMYNDKYNEKNVYKEDAFGRYLSGLIYESVGNLDDAYISYYKAYEAFQDYEKHYKTSTPSWLVKDIFRVGEATDRMSEVRKKLKKHNGIPWIKQKEANKYGKIVMIHLNGLSPVKKEKRIVCPSKNGPITFAFPRYEVKQPACKNSKLIVKSASTKKEAETELIEDINKIAVKNLDDRKLRVMAKMIARAIVRQNITKNKATKQFLNLFERADTRSWRTLPGEIYLAWLYVPKGKYHVYVNQCGEEDRYIKEVNISESETTFVLYNTTYI